MLRPATVAVGRMRMIGNPTSWEPVASPLATRISVAVVLFRGTHNLPPLLASLLQTIITQAVNPFRTRTVSDLFESLAPSIAQIMCMSK